MTPDGRHEGALAAQIEVDRDGIIRRAHGACASLFNQATTSLVGAPFISLFPKGSEGQEKAARLLREPSAAAEIAFVPGDGQERWAQMFAWPERGPDGALQILIIDITEHKRLRLELEGRVADARAAALARDEFLSIATHELRTPLSVLVLQLGNLQNALHEAGEGTNEKLTRRVDKAVKATNRLTVLIDKLLDVSRIATGGLQLRPEACDLAEVARNLLERVAPAVRGADCQLQCQIDAPIPGMWDPSRLEQIFENLLSNAVRYAPGKPIEVTVSKRAATAMIAVRDYGIGISKADVERIFGRFERAVPVRHYGGLGLGLYITRQIVEAHGGTIRVTSDHGAGALFEVELPRVRAFVASAEPQVGNRAQR